MGPQAMRAENLQCLCVMCRPKSHVLNISYKVMDCGISCANAESECREPPGWQHCLGDQRGPPECDNISILFQPFPLIVDLSSSNLSVTNRCSIVHVT